MANRVKGIVVEIGGDTGPLDKALKDVNSTIQHTQAQLRDVEKLLKLDPTNTILLNQKQEMLASAISVTKSKLDTLKAANEQVSKTAGNYDAWEAKYLPIQQEIEKTQKEIVDLTDKQKKLEKTIAEGRAAQEKYQAIQKDIERTTRYIKEYTDESKKVEAQAKGLDNVRDAYYQVSKAVNITADKLEDLEKQAWDADVNLAKHIDAKKKYNDIQKAIEDAENEIKSLENELKKCDEQIEKGVKAKQKYEQVRAELETTEKKLEELKKQSQEADKQLAEGKISQEKYDSIKKQLSDTESDIEELRKVAADAQREMTEGEVAREKYASLKVQLMETEEELVNLKKSAKECDEVIQAGIDAQAKYDAIQDEISQTKQALKDLEEEQAKLEHQIGEGTVAREKYDDLQTRIDNLNAHYEGLQEQAKATEEVINAGQLAREKYDDYQNQIDSAKNKLESLKAKAKEVDEEFGKPISPEKYNDLQREIVETEQRLKDMEIQALETNDALVLIGDTADKLHTISDITGKIGGALTKGLTTPIVGAGTAAVKAAGDFEAGMSKFAAVTDMTQEEFDAAAEKAREMGRQTVFSATEATDALYYMGIAGWDSNESIAGLEGVMNAAAAGGTDLARTSDIITDALTAFGEEADQSTRFANVLVATMKNSNTDIDKLGESFKYASTVAGSLGFSVEDTGIALGLMANSSIKSGQAGNQLKNAMTNLLKPTKAQAEAMVNLGYISQETFKEIDFSKVESAQIAVEKAENSVKKAQMSLDTAIEKYGKNSKQAAQASLTLENAKLSLQAANGKLEKAEDGVSKKLNKNNQLMTNSDGSMKSLKEIMDALRVTLNKTGVDLVDAEGNTREFDDIIKELTQSEEGLAQAKQLESVATIFGKRNMTGMLAIVNASDEDYQKLTNSIYNCNWEVDKLSDELQNSGISWDKYSDKGWAAGKDIGDVCTLMGGEIAQMIQKTGGNAEKLEDVIKIVAGKYGMTMEDARKAVEATQKGIENSSGEAERTAKKMIDNLKGSITLLKDGVIDFGISIGKILMPKVKAVIEKLQDFVNWLNGLNDAQKETIVKIAAVVAAVGPVLLVVSKVTGAISGGLNVVKSLTTTFGKLLINMKYAHGPLDAVGKLFGGISGKVVAVVGVIAVLAAAFIHLWKNNEEFREKMTEIWERLKEVISNFASHFSESWDRLITALQPILEALKNLWDGFCNALAPVFEGAFSIIVSVLEVATDAITAALDIIAQLFTGDFQGAIDTFVGFFEGALDAIGDILYTIFDTVGEFLGRLWDAFHSNPVLGALTDLLCAPFALAKAAIEAIFPEIDGLSSFGVKVEYIFRSVYHAVVDNWNKIGPFFAGVWKTITEKFDGIKDTIIKKWTEAKQKISEIADGMKTAISKKWEEIKTSAATYFEGIKNNIVNEWNRTREEVSTCIENLKKAISERFPAIYKTVTGVFENIRNAAVTKWQNLVTNVTLAASLIRESLIKSFSNLQTNVINAWTNIRNAMTNPIESAKRIIHNAIEAMKGFFNFNWSLPKIKLPHFSISGSFSLNPPSIPHFSVEWYRKAMESGMILNSPTIFGMQGNTLLGGGDAGPEAVVGVESLRNMISEEIRNAGNQARDLTVIFKLKDDTELGRAVYRMYNEESQRVGVRLANV